jgi:hypothetical protein
LIVTARKKVSILFTGVRAQDMSPRRLCRLEAVRADFSDVLVLWSAIIRVVFVSALPLSSDHALALTLAMEYS